MSGGSPAASGTHRINLSWLIQLRWGAIAGQLVTIAVVHGPLAVRLPVAILLAIVGLEVLSNLAAVVWLRLGGNVREGTLVALLAIDVASLTGMLFFTGGPSNPFNFLYLVYIALAAVVLRSGWTWALVGLSVLGSATLFFWSPESWMSSAGDHSHAHHMKLHLEGMWVAFAVAAAFIVYFVTRVRRALTRRELDLQLERSLAARNEKLAALATLAAGAAHELATPLGTIAVVAREIERRATTGAADRDDVALIRAQVQRCRQILDRMSAHAGEKAGEGFTATTVGALLASAVEGAAGVSVSAGEGEARITVPPETVGQAVRGLVRNAQEASPDGGDVSVRGFVERGQLHIEIEDRGTGMTPEVLARVGEPFFTTKPPGQGMGLGVFLSRSIVERLGGSLELRSRPGAGTTVTLRLPSAPSLLGSPAEGQRAASS